MNFLGAGVPQETFPAIELAQDAPQLRIVLLLDFAHRDLVAFLDETSGNNRSPRIIPFLSRPLDRRAVVSMQAACLVNVNGGRRHANDLARSDPIEAKARDECVDQRRPYFGPTTHRGMVECRQTSERATTVQS